ncbi:pentatricopeptide repeat-containing protein DOT4, chloroplastic [Ziziphus jujuba]|uniref:Pentatricopeptide repeat-containing protein DOT4, chloroplastic n=1 Tax=Ziziphus jujuba TaxID=326968 RepID=A0A6P6FS94_ZIZJJ|nr:pentatricopeptide repeat-containing protein DOT4, chloroplastic [Ziziphus jujuba]XP_024924427.3 pentatricopeptide repeat-containing protein DOT4, chloroplastic [Ziziphus jujuba]XP_060676102.1 pentatricopeptide repeat-containing protein DOT4, chloroplastic [Ziziphus jujuba]
MKSFSQMQKWGLLPNSFTIVGLLVSVVVPQSVHGLIVKSGLESDLIVSTALLDAYAKYGNIFCSYKLFQRLDNPSLVSCNAIIAGFVYNELFEEAVSLFNRFRKSGMVPNVATILTLIQGLVALGLRTLCESIHGLVVKFGLSDISVNNSILDMYSSLKDLSATKKTFDMMGCKDIISWTTLIGLYVRLDYASDAFQLFGKMRESGIKYDVVVIMCLCSACGILGDLKKGKQIHAQAVIGGFGSEVAFTNSLISMYCKCGDLGSSRNVFYQTPVKSSISWSAIISAYLQNGCPGKGLDLWIKVRLEENFCLDSIMLVSGLITSGELAALELCLQLHSYAFQAGFSQYRSVQNTLISAYSKCGNIELAYYVFKEMAYLRDIVSWNIILYGCGINGRGEAALALYHEMRSSEEDPDGTTYLCVLNACSHSGLVDDGLMLLSCLVEENKIRLSQEHYGCVADLLARAGCLQEASEFANKLLEGTGPNVWRALLSGCQLHHNVALAELAARKVFEEDPQKSGQVVLLSNIYASSGRFEDAESLRWNLRLSGLVKDPGISFFNGIPYDFG